MKFFAVVATLLFLQLGVLPAAQAANRQFAIIIGNNQGRIPERELRYAEDDARKVHHVFQQLGRFHPADMYLLTGQTDDTVRKTLGRVENAVEAAKAEGDTTFILIYFSGHADGNVLELGQSELPFAEVLRFLRTSNADVRMAILDSCRSGEMINMKGGRRAAEFDIHVENEMLSQGYAVITSSADDELSQESAEIRGSFFSHFWVSALRGAADDDNDGRVTLSEAYKHAYTRTVARTAATVGGGQHPMYEFRIEGQGDVPLTHLTDTQSWLLVRPPQSGRLVIIDAEQEVAVAEVRADAQRASRINLPAGRYTAMLPAGEVVYRAEVEISGQGGVELAPEAFAPQALVRAVDKGGLFAPGWTHGVDARFLLRKFPLKGASPSIGGALVYRAAWRPGRYLLLRFFGARAPDIDASTRYREVGALAGVGFSSAWGAIGLRFEAMLGYDELQQEPLPGVERRSSGLSYLALTGFELPLGPLTFGIEGGAGGRAFKVRERGVKHRFDWQVQAGLGWRGDE